MKLTDLVEAQTNNGKGYSNVTLDKQSSDKIKKVLSDIGVTNVINRLHVTLVYDRSNPNINFEVDPNKQYKATITDTKAMGEPSSKWYAITLVLDSPELVKRHKDYIDAGFKHSYPQYAPHLSLKYKPTEEDIEKIKNNFDLFKNLSLVFTNERLEKIVE